MRHGLCGAQRTGKTTLARAYAETHGLKFVATNTRQVLASIGMDAKTQYPIKQRLFAQNAILSELCSQWKQDSTAIFDRTPIDVLAYMEADVLRDFPNDEETIESYMAYRSKCLAAVHLFDSLTLVQPGITIIEEEGAAQGCVPYMEHFNTLCIGYLHYAQSVNVATCIIDRPSVDLKLRVSLLHSVINTER